MKLQLTLLVWLVVLPATVGLTTPANAEVERIVCVGYNNSLRANSSGAVIVEFDERTGRVVIESDTYPASELNQRYGDVQTTRFDQTEIRVERNYKDAAGGTRGAYVIVNRITGEFGTGASVSNESNGLPDHRTEYNGTCTKAEQKF